MRATNAHLPDHWWFLPIKRGNARVATFFGLMNSTSAAAPISGPLTIDAWQSAADGDASGLWFQSLMAGVAFPEAETWGDVAAVGRADVRGSATHLRSRRQPRLDPGQPRHRLPLGRRAGCATPGPQAPARTSTAGCATRTPRRS